MTSEPEHPGEREHPLEPPIEEMLELGYGAVDYLTSFVEGLDAAPAANLEGVEDVVHVFRRPLPENGRPWKDVFEEVAAGARKAVETAGPGFFGYIPAGGLYASAVGAYLGFGLNRFVGLSHLAPGFSQIESTVVRWFADLFGFPQGAQGVLTSGGSIANLSALVTARKARLPEEFFTGTLYVSEHAHHSVVRAASLAGFPARCVRVVPSTADLRMDPDALTASLVADRDAGLRPFCVVGTAGTTNTGTVDPLDRLAVVCREWGLWFHVDAAYGGFFQMTERGRRVLRGITEADSITLDPHKGMFVPYGTGALIVRDGELLRRAHTAEADYLQDRPEDGMIPSPSDYSPELSRDFRGLRVWLPIQLHGLAAFRDALDEKLDLTRYVFEALRDTEGVEVPWEPDLTLVPFWCEGDDDRGRELLERVNGSKRVFLTSTRVGGRFTLRVCLLSHRTHRDRVEEGVEIIRRTLRELGPG